MFINLTGQNKCRPNTGVCQENNLRKIIHRIDDPLKIIRRSFAEKRWTTRPTCADGDHIRFVATLVVLSKINDSFAHPSAPPPFRAVQTASKFYRFYRVVWKSCRTCTSNGHRYYVSLGNRRLRFVSRGQTGSERRRSVRLENRHGDWTVDTAWTV